MASPTSALTSWPWSTLSPTPPVSRSCWRAPSSQPSSSRRPYSTSPVGRTPGKAAVYYLVLSYLPSTKYLLCRCVYKGRDNKLFLYAATKISKGERLSHSRVRNVCETRDRRSRLLQAGIQCRCALCQDPAESGTFIRCPLSIYL